MNQRTMLKAAIGALALFGAPSVQATPTAPASPASTASTASPARGMSFAVLSPPKRLAFEGGMLRLQGAVSFERLLALLPPDSADVLRHALGYRGDLADRKWSVLLRSAVQYQRIDGDKAETLWWSPTADAGVAIAWKAAGADWRLVGAAPVLGESLRAEPRAFQERPGWSASPAAEGLAATLQKTAEATRHAVLAGALEQAFAHPAGPVDVLMRVAATEDDLILRLGSPSLERNAEARELLTRVSVLTLSKDNAALSRLLSSYSDQQRLMFAPRLVVMNGAAMTVLWVSAGASHRPLLVQYPSVSAIEPSAVAEVSLAHVPGGAP